jgi:predicted phosphodiesterase
MYAGLVTPIRLAIVGDTQRVLPIERLAFGRETNDVGRSKIARAIRAEQLDGIVHLGDLIGAASGWNRFDQDYPPDELSSKQIHVCRGNHDCGGLWFGSNQEFARRYPRAVAAMQEVDLGFLRLLLLDTHEGAMSKGQWRVQLAQFQAALSRADDDVQVKHVFVAGHHPPFTNARWHKPSRCVLEDFVPPFMRCIKARGFFSGHIHGYERFGIDGKYFVVTGGGGGARFSHRHGEKRRRTSVLDLADPHPLHYISVQASPGDVVLNVRAIDEHSETWTDLDRWSA